LIQKRNRFRAPCSAVRNSFLVHALPQAIVFNLVLSIGAASAMPFGIESPASGASLVQEAGLACDRNGRCYDTNRRARASQRYYAPRQYGYNSGYDGYSRGYAQPYYGAYGPPAVGIGVGPFGVGVF
jgi:hypothetical protein